MRAIRVIAIVIVALAGLIAVMQLVPFGRDHTNPPVLGEPAWDSPRTRALAVRACFDCHSNETTWPWYSHVAPLSWVVANHVRIGRSVMNFSEWTRPWELASECSSQVVRTEMPPRSYLLLHPDAQLTQVEREQLAHGLAKTLGYTWE